MQYAIVKNNKILQIANSFEELFPVTIFPTSYEKTQEFLKKNDCYPVETYKEYDLKTQKLIFSPPYIENNRVYGVKIEALTTQEIKMYEDNKKQEERLKLRLLRAEKLDMLKVETSYGHIFDADELSQSRIQKALYLMDQENKDSIEWILADNSKAEIFKPELEEALTLAIKKQSEIWVKSWIDKNEANLS